MDNLSELEMRRAELLYDLEKLDEEINKVVNKDKIIIYEDEDITLQRRDRTFFILKGHNTENFVDVSSDGYFDLQVGFSKETLTKLSKAWLEYIEKENKNAKKKN